MDVFLILCACILIFNLLVYFNLIGLPTSHVLLPYQRGVLFRCGRPVKEVGAGRHRVWAGREKILFLDMRPIQVKTENRAVTLPDGTMAVYGFTANAKVIDVEKATYASTNYNQFPTFVTLSAARSVVSKQMSSQFTMRRATVEEEIVNRCRTQLASAGFELVSFQFSQFNVMGADLDR